ncbi:MAG TPA: PEP/pyruvate-binding domain-containing protein, partial [Anaerolineaceae bacterium]
MQPDEPQEHVSPFDRVFLDPQHPITRIGSGSLGGKAHALVLLYDALRGGLDPAEFPAIAVDIPSMAVIGTDVFSSFMKRNNLYEIAYSGLPDERLAHAFQKADLPFEITGDLRALISQVHIPLAIRSSSLLEDDEQGPFAGIYTTKMIPNNSYDPDIRFRQLVEAVKLVYASTYFQAAREYRLSIGRGDEDEKMAVIIHEMVGKRCSRRFYPELAGVARSYNYYPMPPARPENGVANLALGLGKTVVDGGICWTYSPAFPKVDPPFGSTKNLLKGTQSTFWAVNMGDPPEYDPSSETEYMLQENLTAAEEDGVLRYVASTYDSQSDRLSIGTGFKGPRAITFAPLLVLNQLPVNDLIVRVLEVCEKNMGGPVEIEFAMTFQPHRFALLQVRKMSRPTEVIELTEADLHRTDLLIATRTALGNGILDTVRDIIHVKPEVFDLKHTLAVVPELRRLNEKMLAENRPYLLIVLGRLGTTDPWLGIPIQWGQICGARAVIEAAQDNVKVELSQGSHYFHNIISLGVKYFLLPYKTPFT